MMRFAHGAGDDPGTDDVVDQSRDSLGGVRVIPYEVAHAIAQQSTGDGDLGIGRSGGCSPAAGATTLGRAVVAARYRLKALAGKNAL